MAKVIIIDMQHRSLKGVILVSPGQELSSIDFASMIGGPLIAVVDAQAKAAMSSVNFIKAVGFKKGASEDPEATDTGEPIYVSFKYPKEVAPYQPRVPEVSGVSQVGDPAFPKGMKPDPNAAADAPPNDGIAAHAAGFPVYVAPVAYVPEKAAVPAQIQEMKLEVPILVMLPIPFIRVDETTIDFHAKITSMEYQKIDTNLKFDAALEAQQRWPGGSAKLNVSVSYQKTTQQGSSVQREFSLDIHVKAVQDEMPAGMEKILGILEDAMRAQPVSAPAPVIS
jgi:hypothetical protein